MADNQDDGWVYHLHASDEADIHMEEVVVDEYCSSDHNMDLPVGGTHAREDNDVMEVGGDVEYYGSPHTDRSDGWHVGEVGLLHSNNRRKIGVVSEVEAHVTIQLIHGFASLSRLLPLLQVLTRPYSLIYYCSQNGLVKIEHVSPEQSYASHPICLIYSWDSGHHYSWRYHPR